MRFRSVTLMVATLLLASCERDEPVKTIEYDQYGLSRDGRDGSVKYEPLASGHSLSELADYMEARMAKSEFETSDEHARRLPEISGELIRKFGKTIVVRVDLKPFYDANRGVVEFAALQEANAFLQVAQRGFMQGNEALLIPTPPCPSQIDMRASDAKEFVEGLRSEQVRAYFVGTLSNELNTPPGNSEHIIAGFYRSRIEGGERSAAKRSLLVPLQVARLDIVGGLFGGEVIREVDCSS